jgi:tRNA-splicing ligase RtcB
MSNFDILQGTDVRVPVYAWTRGVPVESVAFDQLKNVAALPFIHKHVAAMPDVHPGMGATIGSVIPTVGAIIPAAVGVDIGCGMVAVRTALERGDVGGDITLPANRKPLYKAIEKAVPHGFGKLSSHCKGGWTPQDIPKAITRMWVNKLADRYEAIIAKHKGIPGKNIYNHLGTLGSGNHFMEVCLDTTDRVWIMLHSGSRGIGNRIGTYFTRLAKEEMKANDITLPDKDLAYFEEGTQHFGDYIEAMEWALDFAQINRDLMVAQIFEALRKVPGVPQKKLLTNDVVINCHHNFAAMEHHFGEDVWVTRKGAVRARAGEPGIIPGNMGDKSYIVEGLGNPDSFNSCSHGAGRTMSRTKAKKLITLDDHIAATEGVECRKDETMLDESKGAYKDIDTVMAAQTDLVAIKHELKGFVCVKG